MEAVVLSFLGPLLTIAVGACLRKPFPPHPRCCLILDGCCLAIDLAMERRATESLAGEAGGVNTLDTQSCFRVPASFANFDFLATGREPHGAADSGGFTSWICQKGTRRYAPKSGKEGRPLPSNRIAVAVSQLWGFWASCVGRLGHLQG
jgi:hypothetical protein